MRAPELPLDPGRIAEDENREPRARRRLDAVSARGRCSGSRRVFARDGGPTLPATSAAPSRSRYAPCGNGWPARFPNQSIVPSSLRPFFSTARCAVDEQRDAGGLVDPVADDHPVAAAVAVGREHARRQPGHRDARRGGVDPDPVRKHDRAALSLELDAGPVDALGNARVRRRPGRSRRTRRGRADSPRRSISRRTTCPRASTMSIVDAVASRRRKAIRPIRVALAHRREHLRHLRAQDRARRQLQLLGIRERERGGDEQRRDESGWRESGHGGEILEASPRSTLAGVRAACRPLSRHRGDRRAGAADEPGRGRRRLPGRGGHRLVAAARPARAPAGARPDARPALVSRLRLLLRGAAAAASGRAHSRTAAAAVREHGRLRVSPPGRSRTSPAGPRPVRSSAASSPRSRCSPR